MLDYRTHSAALGAFQAGLAGLSPADPAAGVLRDLHVEDLSSAAGSAHLGSLLDEVTWLATTGEEEFGVVEEVAALWREGIGLYEALGRFRVALQRALDTPTDSTVVDQLNTAGNALRVLAPAVEQYIKDLQVLRAKVASHSYLHTHPRQGDAEVETWNWADLLQARRTDAFVRELLRCASTPSARAFALGVLARYGANVSGAHYVSQTVGGPRRSHPIRNRVARNSIGAWLQVHHAGMPSLTGIADLIEAQLPDGLDPEIDTLLTTALDTTYPMAGLPEPPSFKVGLERMLVHLRLVDSLRVPPLPAALSDRVVLALFADPVVPYVPSLTDQTVLVESGGQPGVAGSGGGVHPLSYGDDGPTHQQDPDSTETKCGSFWEALGWSFLFLLGGWHACVIRWSDGDRCQLWDDITQNWETAFSNGVYVGGGVDTDYPAQALTASDMDKLAQRPELLQIAADLFTLQSTMWEGFAKAADFLALHGLIYPDGFLDRWRYRQFTTIPAHDENWPRLPYHQTRFDLYPTTACETPREQPRFASGATPAAILTGIPGGGQLSANSVSLSLWAQVVSDTFDADNLDLDADRGWRHPCWKVQGSIDDQPLDVVPLAYDDL